MNDLWLVITDLLNVFRFELLQFRNFYLFKGFIFFNKFIDLSIDEEKQNTNGFMEILTLTFYDDIKNIGGYRKTNPVIAQ